MEPAIPDKPYFRIGEVSQILGLQPYVIRYWESEFRSVRPEPVSYTHLTLPTNREV